MSKFEEVLEKVKAKLEKAEVEELTEAFKHQSDEAKKAFASRDAVKNENRKLKRDMAAKDVDKKLKTLLKKEIELEAKRNNAYKPSQIVPQLQNKFKFDEENDRFVNPTTDKDGNEVLKSVAETTAEFLKDPENDNLVLSKANLGGTGHRSGMPRYVAQRKKWSEDDEAWANEHGFGDDMESAMKVRAKRAEKLGKE